MKNFYFLLFILFTVNSAYATDYYISTSGNDANDGLTPETAWQTLSKINGTVLVPGDRVLFKRGDIFRGGHYQPRQSGTPDNPIYIGAYGSGENPIISGSVVLNSGWVQESDNIWKKDVSAYKEVRQLFINGKKTFYSRFPNEGYLYVSSKLSSKSFESVELAAQGKPDDFFANSQLCIRSKEWYWWNDNVVSVIGGTVELNTNVLSNPDPEEGFYFFGGREMIDKDGEWHYDKVNKMLYVQLSGSPNTDLEVEASVNTVGLVIKKVSNIIVENITIEKQSARGIYVENSSDVILNKLNIRDSYTHGLVTFKWSSQTNRAKNITVSNCTFSDITTKAIEMQSCDNWNVTGNTIQRIGTEFTGFVANGSGWTNKANDGILALWEVKNCTFSKNVIDSIGKSGIISNGKYNIYEKNIIRNFGLTSSDLGGIYIIQNLSKHNIIRNNFTYNGYSYLDAFKKKTWYGALVADKRANGLYGDTGPSENQWVNNTTFNNDLSGIQTLDGFDELFQGNISYNNGKAEMIFIGTEEGISLKDNTFYKKRGGTVLSRTTAKAPLSDETTNNYYISPYNGTEDLFREPEGLINFDQWKEKYPNDDSKTSFFSYEEEEEDQSQLFTNMTDEPLIVPLEGYWFDLEGNPVGESITIAPWYSTILVKVESEVAPGPLTVTGITFSNKSLSWKDNSDNEQGFVLERKTGEGEFEILDTLVANSTGYSDMTTIAGQNYTYKVKSFDSNGVPSLYSNEVVVEDPSLLVETKARNFGEEGNQISNEFKILNNNTTAEALEGVTMRYWFTSDNHAPLNFYLDYAAIGNQYVSGSFIPLLVAKEGANWYLEVAFTGGVIQPSSNSDVIKTRIAKSNYSDFIFTNDHSFNSQKSFVTNENVTLYKEGELIWGVEPEVSPVQAANFKVFYKTGTRRTSGKQIKPSFEIVNKGNQPVPLSELTMRYYFTPEVSNGIYDFNVDYSEGGYPTRGTFETGGNSDYLEVNFDTDQFLYAFSSIGETKTRFNEINWSDFNELNDHSFQVGNNYALNENITLYLNGVLVFGIEPTGTNPSSRKPASPLVQNPRLNEGLVYPNPFTNQLTIDLGREVNDIYTLVIYDYTGKTVINQKLETSTITLNPSLEKGLYFIKVINNRNQTVLQKKVLKQ